MVKEIENGRLKLPWGPALTIAGYLLSMGILIGQLHGLTQEVASLRERIVRLEDFLISREVRKTEWH